MKFQLSRTRQAAQAIELPLLDAFLAAQVFIKLTLANIKRYFLETSAQL